MEYREEDGMVTLEMTPDEARAIWLRVCNVTRVDRDAFESAVEKLADAMRSAGADLELPRPTPLEGFSD
jgi:hypothetical protein